MVNSIFCLYLNDSLKRALAEFIGVTQHSLCIAIYVGGLVFFFFFDLRVFTGLFILQVSGVLYYIGAQRAWLLAFYLVSHGVCWRMPVEREGWDLKLQIWTGKIPSCFEGICFSCLQGCMFFLKVCLWKRASAEAGDVTRFNLICKIEHEL